MPQLRSATLLLLLQSHLVESFSTPAFTRRAPSPTRLYSDNDRPEDFLFDNDVPLTRDEVEGLTVPQLKQQLRLRGLQVSGVKSDLMDRLLGGGGSAPVEVTPEVPPEDSPTFGSSVAADILGDEADDLMLEQNIVTPDEDEKVLEPEVMPVGTKSKARKFAESRGKELIDVTAYVDEEDAGQSTKSSAKKPEEEDEEEEEEAASTSDPEVWGQQAKIIHDYEGRSVVVDNLSRCTIEFKGSNQTMCQAYVVASRDALKAFLAGGSSSRNETAEARLLEIQMKREEAIKGPGSREQADSDVLDQDDDEGYYKDVLHREWSDWGEYTATGAQLSAEEVQGVLLLSDVYGPFTNDTRALAEKIAFECQPVVVMAPDLFRGNPWKEVGVSGLNEQGQTYEAWRATHDDLRVNIDIRAAAACLRERYGVSSVAVWGTCYGGGRALEAASGFFPNDSVHDVDGTTIGPLPVEPMACIAWYPTRYNAKELFGPSHRGRAVAVDGSDRNVAVMAVFAGEDKLAGATPEDAAALKECMEQDERVNDFMVKVFPGQDHGFAHIGLVAAPEEVYKETAEEFVDDEFGGAGRVTLDSGEAEVACLLSTAWMETYSRVFLPTVGPTVSKDDSEQEWQEINMKDLAEANTRDIREEIDQALDEYSYKPDDGGKKLDRFEEDTHDELKKILMEYQVGEDAGENQILQDDDINTAYEKLRRWDSNIQLF